MVITLLLLEIEFIPILKTYLSKVNFNIITSYNPLSHICSPVSRFHTCNVLQTTHLPSTPESVQWSLASRFKNKLIFHIPVSYMCLFYHAYHKLAGLTAPIIIAYELQEDKFPYRSVLSYQSVNFLSLHSWEYVRKPQTYISSMYDTFEIDKKKRILSSCDRLITLLSCTKQLGIYDLIFFKQTVAKYASPFLWQ